MSLSYWTNILVTLASRVLYTIGFGAVSDSERLLLTLLGPLNLVRPMLEAFAAARIDTGCFAVLLIALPFVPFLGSRRFDDWRCDALLAFTITVWLAEGWWLSAPVWN